MRRAFRLLVFDPDPQKALSESLASRLGNSDSYTMLTVRKPACLLPLLRRKHIDLFVCSVDETILAETDFWVENQENFSSLDCLLLVQGGESKEVEALRLQNPQRRKVMEHPGSQEARWELLVDWIEGVKSRQLLYLFRDYLASPPQLDYITTTNEAWWEQAESALALWKQGTPLLLSGEVGSGRTAFAHWLHQRSLSSKHPFFVLDCSAPDSQLEKVLFDHFRTGEAAEGIIPGLLEWEQKGTLLFQNAESLSPSLLATLAHTLQEPGERLHSLQLVFSSCVKVEDSSCSCTAFSPEFLQGVKVVNIPALRERQEEFRELVLQTLKALGAPSSIELAEEVWTKMQGYDWPGNWHQLLGTLRVFLTQCKEQTSPVLQYIPAFLESVEDGCKPWLLEEKSFFEWKELETARFEKLYLKTQLQKFKGDVSAAAMASQMPRGTFYRLLKKHNILAREFRKRH